MNEHQQPLNILIIGAGAIGCTLAWHLSATDANVTLLARGAALRAIEQRGLTLFKAGQAGGTRAIRTTAHLHTDDGWDVIFMCVKQYDLAKSLESLQHIECRAAVIIPLVNGIPWWLLQTHEQLRREPPHTWGKAYASYPQIHLQRVIGGVIHIPAQMRDACTVEQGSRNTLVLGELDGSMSERLHRLTGTIQQSELQCTPSRNIQQDLWNKLLGNAVFNPISALANATMHQMLHEPGLHDLCCHVMSEVMAVGDALGLAQTTTVEQRMQQAASAGDARTSMLQDTLAGRRIEGDTLVGVVVRMAQSVSIHTPTLNGVWALLESRFMRSI